MRETRRKERLKLNFKLQVAATLRMVYNLNKSVEERKPGTLIGGNWARRQSRTTMPNPHDMRPLELNDLNELEQPVWIYLVSRGSKYHIFIRHGEK